jgi:hypothetical protein
VEQWIVDQVNDHTLEKEQGWRGMGPCSQSLVSPHPLTTVKGQK